MAGDALDGGREPVATLRGVVAAYGSTPALDGVSLALGAGEITVLMGPNGAGKSSVVRALCGRLPLSRGEVRVCGGDPRRDSHARRSLALVPQTIALYPRLTAAENLDVFARLAGVPREERRARVGAVGREAGLGDVLSRVVATLSGGYQRRINIAVALLARPRLLLLDEPTVGVDLVARGALQALLRDLTRQGLAILLVTHDFEEAREIADRIAFLRAGRLLREGRPEALLAEAFGGAKRIEVLLAAEPDGHAREALASRGLVAADERLFASPLAKGVPADALFDELQHEGVPVREVRLREPGLDTLYRETMAGAA